MAAARAELGPVRSLAYFERTLAAVRGEDFECPVCLDDVPIAQRWMFPCAHAFCDSCASDVAKVKRICAVCRAPVTPAQATESGRLKPGEAAS